MTSPSELADRFHARWLEAHPFDASYYGVGGFEHLVPDMSEAGEARRRAEFETMLSEARALDGEGLSDAESVTLGCLVGLLEQELAELEISDCEFTVTAMPFKGPAEFLAVASRTILNDGAAESDYLARLEASGRWIDDQITRLHVGAAKGRLPVAPLVDQAITWAERVLSAPVPDALTAPQPLTGRAEATSFFNRRDAVVAEVVIPALSRWVETLRELLGESRPGEKAGLTYLPGGDADYALAIRSHTTLALTAEQLHATGLEQIERLEHRARELGESLGLRDLAAVFEAVRASARGVRPADTIAAALGAVRRAEAALSASFPPPYPEPCAVSPMPAVVGASGMAPHYTPPRRDGARPGTYWVNTEVPSGGSGWDLEDVTFHETVPGHHLQFSRIEMHADLTEMQRQRYITVFSEGWGLYAEQLAEEMGLYSNTEALLGATAAELLRAARLVIDTGLHAFGWGRDRALQFFLAHVPMPPEFLAAEVDRYIVMPGQALAYLTGKLQILAVRDDAQRRLGAAFSLPAFHAAVLDCGSLPIPVLRRQIDRFIAAEIV